MAIEVKLISRRIHRHFILASLDFAILAVHRSIVKSSSALFLQIATVLIGIGTLTLMLWEPHIEGRNTHATIFEICPLVVFVDGLKYGLLLASQGSLGPPHVYPPST